MLVLARVLSQRLTFGPLRNYFGTFAVDDWTCYQSVPQQKGSVKLHQPYSTAYLSLNHLSPQQSSGSICRTPFHKDNDHIAVPTCSADKKKKKNNPFPPLDCLVLPCEFHAAKSICEYRSCVIWSLPYVSGGQRRHKNKVKQDMMYRFSVCLSLTTTHLKTTGIFNHSS